MKSLRILPIALVLALGFISIGLKPSYADDANMGSGMMGNSMGNMMDNSKAQVAASGYCPVCLLSGMAMKGSDHFVTEYKGKIYKFSNMEMQKAFIENPDQYASQDLDAKLQQLTK